MAKEPFRNTFIGRKYEQHLLSEEYQKPTSSLIAIYGRRRVGKTRLVTEFYKDKYLWRFDGIEEGNKNVQIKSLLELLSTHTGNDLYRSVKCQNWMEFVKILDGAISNSPSGYNKTVFLDEFQYMATRKTELISAIKWAWDNLWQDKKGFTLILCGSVASFMVKKVVKSSGLYGRIKLEICLKPLTVFETYDFFDGKKSIREICDLYMFCGGIPEYLLQINPSESVYQNIARLAFCKDGYFLYEFDKIFKDIFHEEKIYKKIIMALSRFKTLKAPELTSMLKVSGGGGFLEYLENLRLAGFVESLVPLDRPPDSKLKRYRLNDEYLLFYFKFIYPNLQRIQNNTDIKFGLSTLKGRGYKSWAGFAFERMCLKHVEQITKILKIDQLVQNYGAYFTRTSNNRKGVQIDLLFVRYDPVVTICELKYSDGLIGKGIIEDLENKIALLEEKNKTIEKVLITTNGVTKDLKEANYFSRVILIDRLFEA